ARPGGRRRCRCRNPEKGKRGQSEKTPQRQVPTPGRRDHQKKGPPSCRLWARGEQTRANRQPRGGRGEGRRRGGRERGGRPVAMVAVWRMRTGTAVVAHAVASVVASVTMRASAGRDSPSAILPVAPIATTAPMTVPATDSTRRGRPSRRAISAIKAPSTANP